MNGREARESDQISHRNYKSGTSTKRSALAVRSPGCETCQRRPLVHGLGSQPEAQQLPSSATPVHIAADYYPRPRVGTHNHLKHMDAVDFDRGCYDAPPTRGRSPVLRQKGE